jgi:hypothetical protein
LFWAVSGTEAIYKGKKGKKEKKKESVEKMNVDLNFDL